MKMRTGFVSNSSSSSFCIRRDKITVEQIDGLKSHDKFCHEKDDVWSIYPHANYIICRTWLDNFDLIDFAIKELDIPEDVIEYRVEEIENRYKEDASL